jgi:hypothetical protein
VGLRVSSHTSVWSSLIAFLLPQSSSTYNRLASDLASICCWTILRDGDCKATARIPPLARRLQLYDGLARTTRCRLVNFTTTAIRDPPLATRAGHTRLTLFHIFNHLTRTPNIPRPQMAHQGQAHQSIRHPHPEPAVGRYAAGNRLLPERRMATTRRHCRREPNMRRTGLAHLDR